MRSKGWTDVIEGDRPCWSWLLIIVRKEENACMHACRGAHELLLRGCMRWRDMALCTAAAHCDRQEIWDRTGQDELWQDRMIQETGQGHQDRKPLFLLSFRSSAPVCLPLLWSTYPCHCFNKWKLPFTFLSVTPSCALQWWDNVLQRSRLTVN